MIIYDKVEIDGIIAGLDERLKKLETPPAREIVVTPQNFSDILVNISNVDFSGSNGEYIQVNRDHNMLAIPCDFENLEAEAEVFIVSTDQSRLLQIQARGGRHSDSAMCEGCAYKGAFGRRRAHHRCEKFHRSSNLPGGNGYCDDRAEDVVDYPDLIGRWAKAKFRVENKDGNVVMQNFVDDIPASSAIDAGDWPWAKTDLPVCPAREFNNAGNRKPNEKLQKAGVWVIFRTDGNQITRYRKLTVREI